MNAQTTSKKDKGFTLVELLIVIVILGILSTVTVFAVRGITNNGKKSACAADKKTLEVAAESYMATNGAYPADVASTRRPLSPWRRRSKRNTNSAATSAKTTGSGTSSHHSRSTR